MKEEAQPKAKARLYDPETGEYLNDKTMKAILSHTPRTPDTQSFLPWVSEVSGVSVVFPFVIGKYVDKDYFCGISP